MHLIRSVSLLENANSIVFNSMECNMHARRKCYPFQGGPVCMENDESQENAFAYSMYRRPTTHIQMWLECIRLRLVMELVAYSNIDLVAWWKNYSKATFISISNVTHTFTRARTYPPTHSPHAQANRINHQEKRMQTSAIVFIMYIVYGIYCFCSSCYQNIDVCKGCLRESCKNCRSSICRIDYYYGCCSANETHFSMDYARFQSGRPNFIELTTEKS